LGESLSSLEKYDAPLDLATTSSLEALQAYRTGQTLFRSGKQREAILFLKGPWSRTRNSVSAYAVLGTAYYSISDDQASRKNYAKAYELKDARLTQEENFQTTALYHAYITGNLEKETAVLVLYQQVYPRSVFAANRWASLTRCWQNGRGVAEVQIGPSTIPPCPLLSTIPMPAKRS